MEKTEIEMLEKNLTKDCGSNEDYESLVDKQRADGRLVAVPEIEWKNGILLTYFVNYLFNLGLAFFPEYEAYEMTFNIAERTKDKHEKKSEPTTPIIQ